MSERVKIATVTLADCEVQTFRAGGKGGQNQNKRDTGVRIIHHPSGARGEARDERSQLQNKKRAFVRMCETNEFRNWTRILAGEDARTVAEVERELWPDRVMVEIRHDDAWVNEKQVREFKDKRDGADWRTNLEKGEWD